MKITYKPLTKDIDKWEMEFGYISHRVKEYGEYGLYFYNPFCSKVLGHSPAIEFDTLQEALSFYEKQVEKVYLRLRQEVNG